MRKKIDWLNHTLEFLVVLIGILIAFQLNQCSENKDKAELIKSHLSEIEAECNENELRINNSIIQTGEQIKNCDSLLELIKDGNNPIEIRNQSTKLLDLRNVDLAKSSYKVLVESGDIRFLRNYDTKRNIISLYEGFAKIEQINKSNQNLYDNHFYPFLKTNFDLVNWSSIKLDSKSEEELYYSREFANTVSTYRFLLIAKKRIYQNVADDINNYLSD